MQGTSHQLRISGKGRGRRVGRTGKAIFWCAHKMSGGMVVWMCTCTPVHVCICVGVFDMQKKGWWW